MRGCPSASEIMTRYISIMIFLRSHEIFKYHFVCRIFVTLHLKRKEYFDVQQLLLLLHLSTFFSEECPCPLSTKFMRSWQNLMCFILQTSIVVHSLTTAITCQKSHNARSYSLLILPSFIQHPLISIFAPTMSFILRLVALARKLKEKTLNGC